MRIIQTKTDQGLIRKKNEDFAVSVVHPKSKKLILLLVADGMGGKEHGDIASGYVARKIEKWFVTKEINTLNNSYKVKKLLENLICKLNNDLIKKYGPNIAGTTLSLAIINKDETIFMNVGDSRGYIYKKAKLIQVTEDDSDVWFYFKYGACKKDDLRYFQNNNIITACIGLNEDLCKITTTIIKNDYEMIMLFTDGVTDMITDSKIKQIIKESNKKDILNNIIKEAVYIDQHFHIPMKLKLKKYSKYVLPFHGRDNASGSIYIK